MCWVTPYQQALFLVVDLHVCFCGGIFGGSGGRDEEIWRSGSHLHSSGLVSCFPGKDRQVYWVIPLINSVAVTVVNAKCHS